VCGCSPTSPSRRAVVCKPTKVQLANIEIKERKMKRVGHILVIIIFVMASCKACHKSDSESVTFITVDVAKNYPKKELILQDFMDVEYIALETTDEFLCQGIVLDVGMEIILVRNQIDDGDIFVYDRTGKGLRKINRFGQGPEEYTMYGSHRVVLDEDNSEIFIEDWSKIVVYDFFGKFLRSFPKENAINMLNFDKEHLICQDLTYYIDKNSTESLPFTVVSKKDGNIVRETRIHFNQVVNTNIKIPTNREFILDIDHDFDTFLPSRDKWILMDPSSDTIYSFSSDYSMTPFIVREPSIYSMSPEVYLCPGLLTDRYFFMETLKNEYTHGIYTPGVPDPFPKKKLMYDMQELKIYEYTINNDDYTNKKTVSFSTSVKNKDIPFWQKIEAFELVEFYAKGELKGKLKEVAAEMNEDDNPLIMLIKNKK
jgi:hypothetical protein